jgi:hypothetical protein
MKSRLIRLAPLLAAAVMLLGVGPAAAATIWSPLTSGTSANINSVAAPSSSEVVFTTATTGSTTGAIYYLNSSGGFTAATVTPAPVHPLTSIAMSSDGKDGVAVGAEQIYISTDSGQVWTQATTPQEYETGSCGDGWTGGKTTLSDPLLSATFVPGSTAPYTVYLTGGQQDTESSVGDDIFKGTIPASGTPTFTEVNKDGTTAFAHPADTSDVYCLADDGFYTGTAMNDSVWTSATTGFFVTDGFGTVMETTDGLTDTANGTTVLGEAINGDNPDTIAVDSADTNEMWVAGGVGLGDGIDYSTNGGATFSVPPGYIGDNTMDDIANSGTTVVAVGQSGDIWTSGNGSDFVQQDAPSPLNATNWNSVAMVPGTNEAIVGGNGGALVVTTAANTVPDLTMPTGTISGPTALVAGTYGTYTIAATDNPGGSGVNPASYSWSADGQTATGVSAKFAFATAGTYTITCDFADLAGNKSSATYTVTVVKAATGPGTGTSTTPVGTSSASTTTGGATVGIYRKVKLGTGKGRYIPVNLKDKAKRKFIIQLLTKAKKPKRLSQLTVTLDGKATVHLSVPKNVKSGTYEIEVRIYKTGKHGKQTGKSIKQVFVLS